MEISSNEIKIQLTELHENKITIKTELLNNIEKIKEYEIIIENMKNEAVTNNSMNESKYSSYETTIAEIDEENNDYKIIIETKDILLNQIQNELIINKERLLKLEEETQRKDLEVLNNNEIINTVNQDAISKYSQLKVCIFRTCCILFSHY